MAGIRRTDDPFGSGHYLDEVTHHEPERTEDERGS